MTKKHYIAGLSIQPDVDIGRVVKELNKVFNTVYFEYRKSDEFPSYKAEYKGIRIDLLGAPTILNVYNEITTGKAISGADVEKYSFSFLADESYLTENIPELLNILPVTLKLPAVGSFEITPYLLNF